MRGIITALIIAGGFTFYSAPIASAEEGKNLSESERLVKGRSSRYYYRDEDVYFGGLGFWMGSPTVYPESDVALLPESDFIFLFDSEISGGGRGGTIDRPSAMFLRTELGGNIISPYFLNIQRNDVSFSGFDFRDVKYDIIDPFGFFSNDFWDVYFGYSRVRSSFSYHAYLFDAGGAQLGVLSPAGPGGALGGGIITAAGFGNVENVDFSDSYEEQFFRVGIQNTYKISPVISISPRIGYAYGTVEEESSLRAVTNMGTFPFEYHNMIEVDRHILEIGGELKYSLTTGAGVYVDGDLRLIRNEASGYSKLTAGNFLPEIGSHSLDDNDVGGRIGAGLFIENQAMRGKIGVEYETWEVPSLHIPGDRSAYLAFEDRDSVAVRGELTVFLRPFLVENAE